MGKTVVSSIRLRIQKKLRLLRAFFTKLGNDWVMSAAAALAYNLINATIPIAIFLLAVFGFTIGNLDPPTHVRFIENVRRILPIPVSTQRILEPAFATLSRDAGFLTILALLAAIFGGSRLFIAIEGYVDIIYRTGMRKPLAQNVMAVLMLCIFTILTPLMVFASFIPALLQDKALNRLPGMAQLAQNGFVLSVTSILESIIVAWILFQTIYMVVPNQKVRFKNSWKGALTAAIFLEFFLLLFPFYITHFMDTYTGAIGFVLILLFYFYYFSVILLFGAEVNAFYAEGVRGLPDNLANFLRLPVNEAGKEDTDDLNWF